VMKESIRKQFDDLLEIGPGSRQIESL